MPKTNYAYEKRQRELASKRKKDEKATRKSRPSDEPAGAPSAKPESAVQQTGAGETEAGA